jgi:hypothetical protein
MAQRTLGDVADTWMKFSAFGAIAYFIYALLPYTYFGMRSASDASSDLAGRAQALAVSLMFAVVFYGLRKHTSIYWKVIPTLIGIYGSTWFLGGTWTLYHRSQPRIPLVAFGGPALLGAFLIFIVWWRKQRSYFGRSVQ